MTSEEHERALAAIGWTLDEYHDGAKHRGLSIEQGVQSVERRLRHLGILGSYEEPQHLQDEDAADVDATSTISAPTSSAPPPHSSSSATTMTTTTTSEQRCEDSGSGGGVQLQSVGEASQMDSVSDRVA